jgi:predicted NBD/HSP70 family sugar kinase
MANYIGIDIGGTTIKYGLLTAGGTFLHKGSVPTEVLTKGVPQFLEKLVEIVKGYQRGRDEAVQELKKAPTDLEVISWAEPIKGVGLATAGIVNPETGKILFAPRSFPGYEGTQLKKLIEERCLFPCAVENDVNAAALGEFWLGAGRGAKSLFCITVGTGIGGALILDGKLVQGATYSAGEIGYSHIGEPEIFENLAATSALVRDVAAAKNLEESQVDGKKIFAWAQAGDTVAAETIDKMVARLAAGIANVCYIANPEVIVLGGGIMAQAKYIGPRLDAELKKALLPVIYKGTRGVFAKLGNDAGMVGAVYNLLHSKSAGK